MKSSLQPGVSMTRRIAIDRDRTIGFMGEDARVYATPSMIMDIERTCRDLIMEHADAGEDSVGIEVSVKHLAATLPGMNVEIVVKVDERRGTQGCVRGFGEGRARRDQHRHAFAVCRRCRQDGRAAEGEGREAGCAEEVGDPSHGHSGARQREPGIQYPETVLLRLDSGFARLRRAPRNDGRRFTASGSPRPSSARGCRSAPG